MSIAFPCLNVCLVPVSSVRANDYNPNRVAVPEMELLRISIEADGLTQPIVVFRDPEGGYIVVDGFHRFVLLRDHFKCIEIPVVIIDKPLRDRMASTIRHNRARGKHQVDAMAEKIVERLLREGWEDDEIAHELGMSPEEVLRLKQMVGVARVLAAREYSRSWGDMGADKDKTVEGGDDAEADHPDG